jgi:hypothetical protein
MPARLDDREEPLHLSFVKNLRLLHRETSQNQLK